MSRITSMKYEICGKAVIDEKDIEKILSFGFSKVEIKLKKENFKKENYEYTKNFLLRYQNNICSIHIYHAELNEFAKGVEEIITLYSDVFKKEKPTLVLHSNRILNIMLLEYHSNLLEKLLENDIPFCIESQPGESYEFFESFILPKYNFCLDVAHFWVSHPYNYKELLESLLNKWMHKIKVIHINCVKIKNNVPMDNQPLSLSLKPPIDITLQLFKKYIKSSVPFIVEVPPEYQKASRELLISLLGKS